MVFRHDGADRCDQVCQERIERIKIIERMDILFGKDDHVEWMGWFWVMESQQSIRLTQSFGRDDKAHVGKYPTGQETSCRRIRQPGEQTHQQSPMTTFPSSIEVMHTSDSIGTP